MDTARRKTGLRNRQEKAAMTKDEQRGERKKKADVDDILTRSGPKLA
jgi:hypothetical protein